MSDIEIIREALESARYSHGMGPALAALDRIAAALERAEREKETAEWAMTSHRTRAEKAERALAEMREALEASDALIRFLRPDLSHTRSRADEVVARNRAALLPEDTSDES